ncbi:MAG: class I SAM-dependent methyltransferase [Actinobacteria bacterium]|nr:MAG: class I SAM-dependent methyltransferase [Actinomycetota bacterium]
MEVSSNYEKYTNKNPLITRINLSFLDSISTLVQKNSPKKILDAGCGEGFVLEHLRKDVNADFIGLDIESNALDIARLKNPQIDFKHASVYEQPFEDNSFDLVILSEVLEHLEEPDKALSEVSRVTKRYALISVPQEPIWRVGNLARLKYMRSFGNTPGHINHWTRRAFVGLISNYFDVREIKSPIPWTIALCQLKEVN